MYRCPQNHDSETADFCSVCGAELSVAPVGPAAASTAAPAALPAAGAAASSGRACPDCGTPGESPGQVFCEVCGHNFHTGMSGVPPVTAAQPSSLAQGSSIPEATSLSSGKSPGAPLRWGVTVRVDSALYGVINPDAPVGQPPQVFSMFESENLIGRHAPGVRAHVPVHNDPGVSRRHAMLLRGPDGSLSIRDLGSANGTQLNGVDLVPGVDHTLKDGDAISLGAWTKIVIHAAKTATAVSS
jgi:hypothetical protein